MTNPSLRIEAYDAAIAGAQRLLSSAEPKAAFALLERAHVLGQRDYSRHWRVHVLMLRAARAMGDGREVRGQLMRLALTPLGHLTRRLPLGNTGGANVNAFVPMDIPPDLRRLLEDKDG